MFTKSGKYYIREIAEEVAKQLTEEGHKEGWLDKDLEIKFEVN